MHEMYFNNTLIQDITVYLSVYLCPIQVSIMACLHNREPTNHPPSPPPFTITHSQPKRNPTPFECATFRCGPLIPPGIRYESEQKLFTISQIYSEHDSVCCDKHPEPPRCCDVQAKQI